MTLLLENSPSLAGSAGSSSGTLYPDSELSVISQPQIIGDPRVLVLGDIHGHYARLERLLWQEGIIGPCPGCSGLGQQPSPFRDSLLAECTQCDGDGIARIDFNTRVVLVGDIGHFGVSGSPTGDLLTWKAAVAWADVILWGNHDRAVFENHHHFENYLPPRPETKNVMEDAMRSGKLRLAVSYHGFLITHAGLHLAFRNQRIDPYIKEDPAAFADWINDITYPGSIGTPDQMAVRDAIPRKRGGNAPAGGILWRDIDEKLYDKFRQIFGHSADHKEQKVRYCYQKEFTRTPALLGDNPSYCIDVGGPSEANGASDNCLAGIYLSDEQIVKVNL